MTAKEDFLWCHPIHFALLSFQEWKRENSPNGWFIKANIYRYIIYTKFLYENFHNMKISQLDLIKKGPQNGAPFQDEHPIIYCTTMRLVEVNPSASS